MANLNSIFKYLPYFITLIICLILVPLPKLHIYQADLKYVWLSNSNNFCHFISSFRTRIKSFLFQNYETFRGLSIMRRKNCTKHIIIIRCLDVLYLIFIYKTCLNILMTEHSWPLLILK